MATAVSDDVVRHLERAANQLHAQQKQEQREHKARMAELHKREDLVREAIEGLRTGKRVRSTPGVSQERIDMVVEYLKKNPRSRQVDIGRNIIIDGKPMNSGTVSVATKQLEAEGRITLAEKEDGSKVWVLGNSKPSDRELVLHVGEGARKGRRKLAKAA